MSGALLGCLFSPLLLADDSPLTLDRQFVSAPSVESTTVAEMARYGSKVEIIDRQQIERAGPSSDITRVLQMYVPGLYVAPKNGPFDYGTYSLLGGRNDDTLILLDGVRLNNRLYGGLYLDTLPANAIERIEVLKGGQSLLFGTQAVSGVINIVTRSPQTRDVSGEVNLGLDSFMGQERRRPRRADPQQRPGRAGAVGLCQPQRLRWLPAISQQRLQRQHPGQETRL